MKVGILGLGLIGGSLSRAYSKAGNTVYAYDRDKSILDFAQLAGVINAPLSQCNIGECDLILLAVYTGASIDWLKQNAPYIAKSTLVIDTCGMKSEICRWGFSLAQEFGFTFVGGHPMAGSHNSGFKHSRSNLFAGAPMVLVPHRYDDPELLERVKIMLSPCGFKNFSITTAEEHDKMIAFTSQMPHIVSNAFIKSPTAINHSGFSAGSYKDLTRVAWLNPEMWAELIISNKENIQTELSVYIANLKAYLTAVENNDFETLTGLLQEGRLRKEEIDG